MKNIDEIVITDELIEFHAENFVKFKALFEGDFCKIDMTFEDYMNEQLKFKLRSGFNGSQEKGA